MTIEQSVVTRFAKRAVAINRATKRQKELRAEILAALMKGDELPTTGMYIIKLSQVGGKEFSWEESYAHLLTKMYEKKYGLKVALVMAKDKMQKMKEEAPDKEAVEIHGESYVGGVKMEPGINPDYRQVARSKAA